MTSLGFGAVAVIDALGFKGIWRGVNGDDVSALATLRSTRDAVETMMNRYTAAMVRGPASALFTDESALPQTSVLCASDGIVVTAIVPPLATADTTPSDDVTSFLLEMVCLAVAYAMRTSTQCHPPLVYRGAIAVGKVLVDGPFFIGPAIDEAAEHANAAQGSFVWFSPSARAVPRKVRPVGANHWPTLVHEYAVPMKNGQLVHSVVVSPCVDQTEWTGERARIRAGIERAMMSDRPSVAAKRENTLSFLDHCDTEDRMLAARVFPPGA